MISTFYEERIVVASGDVGTIANNLLHKQIEQVNIVGQSRSESGSSAPEM
jgi:hypothetical protein